MCDRHDKLWNYIWKKKQTSTDVMLQGSTINSNRHMWNVSQINCKDMWNGSCNRIILTKFGSNNTIYIFFFIQYRSHQPEIILRSMMWQSSVEGKMKVTSTLWDRSSFINELINKFHVEKLIIFSSILPWYANYCFSQRLVNISDVLQINVVQISSAV